MWTEITVAIKLFGSCVDNRLSTKCVRGKRCHSIAERIIPLSIVINVRAKMLTIRLTIGPF